MAISPHEQVVKTLNDLRAHIVMLTNKPVDRDVDNATTLIETLTAAYMLPSVPNEWHGMKLTHNWRRVLDCLASRPNHIFSKSALMSAVYFDKTIEPGPDIIDVYICKVRTELRRANAPIWIETVWGLGYRMVYVLAREGASRLQPCGPGGRFGNQNARKYPKPVAS